MRTTAVLTAALALAVSLAAFGQEEVEIKRVLVPISVSDTPGANGSIWTSELWAVNGSETQPAFAIALPCRLDGSTGCAAADVAPNRSVRLPNWGNPSQPGVLLMSTPNISYTLHVRDKSRGDLTWGTEVPVVREDEFLTEDAHLTGIPAGPAWRQTLRIYSMNQLGNFGFDGFEFGGLTFDVKLYAVTPSGDQLLRRIEVKFPASPIPPPNQIPSPLSQTTITDLFANTSQYERLRLTIEPDHGGFFGGSPYSYWAFVSVTNNETNQVATVVARK